MINKNPRIFCLLLAAGSGTRFGATLPKQYTALMDKPLIRWSIEAFKNHPLITDVLTVINPDHQSYYQQAVQNIDLLPPVCSTAPSRQDSVRLGLDALRPHHPDYVLIHDAARPLVSASLIKALCAEVLLCDAVTSGLPVTDTLKRAVNNSLTSESRDNLWTIQTPQAFRFDLIARLHREYKGGAHTDDSTLCEQAQLPVKIILGERRNIKLTYPQDFADLEESLLFSSTIKR
jgi:2-C-methyl-D-erythritol 4-phosphate cytidylyltransferase/2-C-methyl-D-erythritol 2,4-cyclodiphosphate synthase